MKVGYIRWDFHCLMSTSPLSLGCCLGDWWPCPVPAFECCLQTYVREAGSIWWTSTGPWLRSSCRVSWGIPLWREGTLSLKIKDLEKDEECPKYRLVLANRKIEVWPIVSQALLDCAQTVVWLPIHWDLESHRLHFLNPQSTSPEIHFPANPQILIIQVGSVKVR